MIQNIKIGDVVMGDDFKKGKKVNFDAKYSCANIKKIKKRMNFFPKMSLENGIKSLLNE